MFGYKELLAEKERLLSEKDARIADLQSQIADLRKWVIPDNAPASIPVLQIEEDAVLSGRDEIIDVSPDASDELGALL